ncbi:hypothetical protein I4U23_006162 [Adineta vaga]|nr:hypothetical protein I4U23_006162 [Adineta vaga]
MKDSIHLPQVSPRRICINEIFIRNHPYIVSMSVDNILEQAQVDIKIEQKETADQWKSNFDTTAIETMTTKTGNYKPFHVFIEMLENAINKTSSSVSIDLLTSADLDMMRKKLQDEKKSSSTKVSTKRYLILIYKTEYDCTNYVLSLRYNGKSDPVNLVEQIQQLTIENQSFKSQLQSNLQSESFHLKNHTNVHQRLLLNNSMEKDQQIEFLREMIRRNEEALIKARIHLQKTKTRKDNRCKTFNDQIESLKTSERQLKSKVKVLTNENSFLRRNCSFNDSQQLSGISLRPVSNDQRRPHFVSNIQRLPSSYDSSNRFDPTAYINARNDKIRQTEWQKKKETRRALSAGRSHSDSDLSDITLKQSKKQLSKSNHQQMKNYDHYQSNDSIDSDIERVAPPLILHRPASNNSTMIYSPEQNENSFTLPHIPDTDQYLKCLQKFYKQNFFS